MAKKPKKKQNDNTIARNRKARFDYTIESNFEAGLVLEGWEVKSLRAGKVQIDESYIFAMSKTESSFKTDQSSRIKATPSGMNRWAAGRK